MVSDYVKKHTRQGKLLYQRQEYTVWLTNGSYKVRIAYPTHALQGKEKVLLDWDESRLIDRLSRMRRIWSAAYGGTWDMFVEKAEREIAPVDRPLFDRDAWKQSVLAGKDCHERRFLIHLAKEAAKKMTVGADDTKDYVPERNPPAPNWQKPKEWNDGTGKVAAVASVDPGSNEGDTDTREEDREQGDQDETAPWEAG